MAKTKTITIAEITSELREKSDQFFLGLDPSKVDGFIEDFTKEADDWSSGGDIIGFRVNDDDGNVLTLVRHDGDTYRMNRSFIGGDKWQTSVDVEAFSAEDALIKMLDRF